MSFGISFTIQSDQITPEEIDQITSILTGFKTGEAPKKLCLLYTSPSPRDS